jgi:flagellar hook assembly protein FlgD
VRLAVYNASGRKVAEVVRGEREAGVHTVEWDAARLPNGIYYYHIAAGARTGAAKLVLVR